MAVQSLASSGPDGKTLFETYVKNNKKLYKSKFRVVENRNPIIEED